MAGGYTIQGHCAQGNFRENPGATYTIRCITILSKIHAVYIHNNNSQLSLKKLHWMGRREHHSFGTLDRVAS